ncbi:CPBP family intramembrane metalloprotease [Aestuariibaculum sp. M13]|uniref:CPBP family intramembrane glutamic endopeptidase n=1 Tax=Aestuariibaculum sp. M13 TaxID=2967132 RepID=UPI002159E9E7|nr:CPBP family intramembrane glutamic endopeptidase [Aestuariibaculum sp. M13]MCR8668068.1 CPBP family intramembrane metalloprotease [Aestuariibaculum sp. M13]
MTKNLYLNLILSFIILLIGYNYSSQFSNIWITRFGNFLSIIIAGLFLIKFKASALPEKHSKPLKVQWVYSIIIGVIGLYIFNSFTHKLTCSLFDFEYTGEINRTTKELIELIFMIAILGILEEFYFRRIIAQKILNSKGFSKALWISALIFSLAHIVTDSSIFSTFIGGLFFGYIYLKTQNLWLTIFAHMSYNLITFLISPIIDSRLSEFNTNRMISYFLALGLGLLIIFYLILKRQTNLKPAGNIV